MQSKKVAGRLALGSKVVVAWMEKWEGVSFIFFGMGGGGMERMRGDFLVLLDGIDM